MLKLIVAHGRLVPMRWIHVDHVDQGSISINTWLCSHFYSLNNVAIGFLNYCSLAWWQRFPSSNPNWIRRFSCRNEHSSIYLPPTSFNLIIHPFVLSIPNPNCIPSSLHHFPLQELISNHLKPSPQLLPWPWLSLPVPKHLIQALTSTRICFCSYTSLHARTLNPHKFYFSHLLYSRIRTTKPVLCSY